MKLTAIICLFSFFLSCEKVMSYHEKEVLQNRVKKDQKFKNSSKSPLSDVEKEAFQKLNYFDYNTHFRVLAEFKRFTDSVMVDLPTTQGLKKQYLLYGQATFNMKGKVLKLTILKTTIYKSDHYFIPFRDKTTAKSTYYTGRYMEAYIDKESKKILIDFNQAYNPWCNYSDDYNCPIPVSINYLDIEIEAGEKLYHRSDRK